MASDRPQRLLIAAAEALEAGRDPLAQDWLVEHDVSLTEVYDLASSLAIGARLVHWATEHPEEAAAALDSAQLVMLRKRLDRVLAGWRPKG